MSYVIIAGAGLLLGLGLLVWGLRERAKRHAAEKQALRLSTQLNAAKEKGEKLAQMALKHRQEMKQAELAASKLRDTMDLLRTRLIACQDPTTIKEWLDHEMADNDV